MKFLANENFPNPSVQILRNSGLDVISVSESRPSISDEEVIKWASSESRIILTFDKDYGEIVFRYRIPCSVIFFREKGNAPTDSANTLLEILKEITVEGHFTVVDKAGIRQRALHY